MSAIRSLSTLGLAAALFGPPARAADSVSSLPRYRFQVGQELVYSGSGEFKYGQGDKSTEKSTWRVWVVRENKEGGWRVVLRHGRSFSRVEGSGKEVVANETVSFTYCDILPNGRMEENDSFGFRQMPSKLLPPLPENEEQARQGWTVKEARLDETLRCHLLPKPAGVNRCALEVNNEAPMNIIYGYTAKDVVTFDTQRGLPEKIESESRQGYGIKSEGKGAIKLDEVKMHDADWTRNFARDAERYFTLQQAYEKAIEGKHRTAAEVTASLSKAASDLKTARAELKMPEFQKQVDEMISKHEQSAKWTLEDAKRREEVLDKPAAEWSTTDLDGKTHALKDYRGKVVILDFWYRGCGWCIRSMPQMKQVADHFKDKPVVVFGMNIDRKEEDAKFVIEKMGLNYRSLKATGLPEKYKVQGYPTLLIIDPQGVVRDIHVGYSPTLKEEVVRSVERLLAAKP